MEGVTFALHTVVIICRHFHEFFKEKRVSDLNNYIIVMITILLIRISKLIIIMMKCRVCQMQIVRMKVLIEFVHFWLLFFLSVFEMSLKKGMANKLNALRVSDRDNGFLIDICS